MGMLSSSCKLLYKMLSSSCKLLFMDTSRKLTINMFKSPCSSMFNSVMFLFIFVQIAGLISLSSAVKVGGVRNDVFYRSLINGLDGHDTIRTCAWVTVCLALSLIFISTRYMTARKWIPKRYVSTAVSTRRNSTVYHKYLRPVTTVVFFA